MRFRRALLPFLAALLPALPACTEPGGDDDAGLPDADLGDVEADGEAWGHECETAYDCSNGVYCDGV
jgi:hypothetical protein